MQDDNTTTEVVEDQAGAIDAQPTADTTTATADVKTETVPSETSTDDAKSDESDMDAKLLKFANSQGIELDSPSAIKAAQIAMKAQSEATRNYQQKSELEKTLETRSDEVADVVAEQTGQNPDVIRRLQRMEIKDAVRDFWNQPNIDRTMEPKMIEILSAKPHLAGDLESLYATALVQSGNLDTVKSQGRREALENLAQKQQATAPTGNATNFGTVPKAKPFNELSIKEMEAQLGFARQ